MTDVGHGISNEDFRFAKVKKLRYKIISLALSAGGETELRILNGELLRAGRENRKG